VIAGAYQGRQIQQAIVYFLAADAGENPETLPTQTSKQSSTIRAGGKTDALAHIGHEDLMGFSLPAQPKNQDPNHGAAIILAGVSNSYVAMPLCATGAYPLPWTTGLMAPEAYT